MAIDSVPPRIPSTPRRSRAFAYLKLGWAAFVVVALLSADASPLPEARFVYAFFGYLPLGFAVLSTASIWLVIPDEWSAFRTILAAIVWPRDGPVGLVRGLVPGAA